MRHTPHFLMTEPAEVKRLIQRSPWTKLSHNKSRDVVGQDLGSRRTHSVHPVPR